MSKNSVTNRHKEQTASEVGEPDHPVPPFKHENSVWEFGEQDSCDGRTPRGMVLLLAIHRRRDNARFDGCETVSSFKK